MSTSGPAATRSSPAPRCAGYRDLLRDGHPGAVRHVTADPALIGDRLSVRKGHYMPASLLHSQLATLEPLADRTSRAWSSPRRVLLKRSDAEP